MKCLILLLFLFVGARCQTNCPDYTKFSLIFIGNNLTDYVNITLTSGVAALRYSGFPEGPTRFFKRDADTVIYTNGWRLNYNSPDTQAILGNYLSTRNKFGRQYVNLVYIDWSVHTMNWVYLPTLKAIPKIHENVYTLLDTLTKDSKILLNLERIHFIGYDLGAHLNYMIADKIFFSTTKRVKRLTGLDPTGLADFGPWLFFTFGINTLERRKAVVTDVIYTSMKKFGFWPYKGDINFYVNGGDTQAGCTAKASVQQFLNDQDLNKIDDLACSHSRAHKYYAESITYDFLQFKFVAKRCESYPGGLTFPLTDVNCQVIVGHELSMGHWAGDQNVWSLPFTTDFNTGGGLRPGTTFDYLVATNEVKPYSK